MSAIAFPCQIEALREPTGRQADPRPHDPEADAHGFGTPEARRLRRSGAVRITAHASAIGYKPSQHVGQKPAVIGDDDEAGDEAPDDGGG